MLPGAQTERSGTLLGRSSADEPARSIAPEDALAEAQPTADPQPAAPVEAVNRIVFIGPDRNVYTVAPDGTARTALTVDAQRSVAGMLTYQHVTWSPDSTQVSFVRLGFEDGASRSALLTAPVAGGTLTELFSSREIFPFYLLWSPDSRWISFLSNAPGDNSIGLYLSSPAGGEPMLLDRGQPFYWAWAPDSSRIFVDTGARDQGRLAFLSPDAAVAPVDLDLQPTAFQAPSWSAGGDALLLAIEQEDGDALVLIDENGGIERELARVGGNTAFTLSPDGRSAAFIEGRPLLGAGTIGALRVLDVNAAESPITAPDPLVLTFFWSPDSTQLVYFTVDDGSRQQAKLQRVQNDSALVLSMVVLDVASGQTRYLGAITPTEQFLSVSPILTSTRGRQRSGRRTAPRLSSPPLTTTAWPSSGLRCRRRRGAAPAG